MKNLFAFIYIINLPIKLSLSHLKIKFRRNKTKKKGKYSTLACHKNFIPWKKSIRQNLANSLSPKETNFGSFNTPVKFPPNYPATFPFFELTFLSLSLSLYVRVNKRLIHSLPDSWTIPTFPTFRIRPRTNETDGNRSWSAIYADSGARTIRDHAISFRRALARFDLKRNIEARPSMRFINSRYERLDPHGYVSRVL